MFYKITLFGEWLNVESGLTKSGYSYLKPNSLVNNNNVFRVLLIKIMKIASFYSNLSFHTPFFLIKFIGSRFNLHPSWLSEHPHRLFKKIS